jgi:hypothetical protein
MIKSLVCAATLALSMLAASGANAADRIPAANGSFGFTLFNCDIYNPSNTCVLRCRNWANKRMCYTSYQGAAMQRNNPDSRVTGFRQGNFRSK